MNKIRHPYINNPFGFKLPEPKPVIYPIIEKWEDFSEKDKKILSEIKRIILSYIGKCEVCVFGSRIKGNWDDESDYDIMVISTINNYNLINQVMNHKYDVEIDIVFSSKFLNCIEII